MPEAVNLETLRDFEKKYGSPLTLKERPRFEVEEWVELIARELGIVLKERPNFSGWNVPVDPKWHLTVAVIQQTKTELVFYAGNESNITWVYDLHGGKEVHTIYNERGVI